MKPHALLVFALGLVQVATAQLPKVPGTNKRIETTRATSGTPTVTGVTGACKNGATRDIVIKIANIDPSLTNNIKVEGHPPFEVVSSKFTDGELHVTVKTTAPAGANAQYAGYDKGPDRCDFSVKFFASPTDQYPKQELYASSSAEPSDAYLAQQDKQKQQMQQQNAQVAAAQEQMKKAQPAMQAHQKASVGDKWTVTWASGKTETWNFTGMDSQTNMAVFKSPSGDIKIMFAGMFYTIMQGQCAMMAQPDGQGKVSGKTMGGNCASSGAFTATLE